MQRSGRIKVERLDLLENVMLKERERESPFLFVFVLKWLCMSYIDSILVLASHLKDKMKGKSIETKQEI